MKPQDDIDARIRAVNRRAMLLQALNAVVWGLLIAGFAWAAHK